MLFENFYKRNESRRAVLSCVPKEYDYSHLVDRPVTPQQEQVKRTGFDAILSDYDRVLLQFGMHILCER
jgi:hypothetical protein